MNVTTTAEGSTLTAAVEGSIDTSTSDDFFDAVSAALSDATVDLVVDLEAVDFVSSKGLRALVKLYKQMGDGHFKVMNPNAAVKRVIDLSSLSKRFGCES